MKLGAIFTNVEMTERSLHLHDVISVTWHKHSPQHTNGVSYFANSHANFAPSESTSILVGEQLERWWSVAVIALFYGVKMLEK
jgi:hypothetical protein